MHRVVGRRQVLYACAMTLPCMMQGMVVLTASAWVPGLTPGSEDGPAKWWQGAFLFGALYIVALGTGGTSTGAPIPLCMP